MSEARVQTFKLKSMFVRREDDAAGVVRAMLHSILFVRALGLCASADGECTAFGDVLYYARCNNERIEHRVEQAVSSVYQALRGGCAPVVDIEVEFRAKVNSRVDSSARRRTPNSSATPTPSPSPKQTLGAWASWLTNSLVQPTPPSSPASSLTLEPPENDFVWERWRWRVYLVSDDVAKRRNSNLRATLMQIVMHANDHVSRLPPIRTHALVTYPFRIHVRENSQDDVRRPASNPLAIGASPPNSSPTSLSLSPSAWWNSVRLSPGSGTWENGLDILRDIFENAPRSSTASIQ